jgi:hypothetical protein
VKNVRGSKLCRRGALTPVPGRCFFDALKLMKPFSAGDCVEAIGVTEEGVVVKYLVQVRRPEAHAWRLE